jgi:hypothetical protein
MRTTCLKTGLCVLLGCLVATTVTKAIAGESLGQLQAIPPPTLVSLGNTTAAAQPALRIDADCQLARLPFLSWDTEGGDRAKKNLLRAGVSLKRRREKSSVDLTSEGEKHGAEEVRFRLDASGKPIDWTIRTASGGLTMRFGGGKDEVEQLELDFPFNPLMTATTLLPARWESDGSLRLPAVISALDFGQMLLSSDAGALVGSLRGSRANHSVDFSLELPVLHAGKTVAVTLAPLDLSPPADLQDKCKQRRKNVALMGSALRCRM